ncbi:hypothetical protein [Paraburkholderia aspalathi]|uniref:hypothetical protein n=1 Tax=Paraburkholderia aspalathi TaxID=1324617 RepID=UPI0038B8C8F5
MSEYVRGATPDEDRYHTVNADLSRGDAVKLPKDMPAADPFIGQITSRLGAIAWSDKACGGKPALAAAVSTFHAGASVHDAIELGLNLTFAAKAKPGDAMRAAYASAGARAGILQRAGTAPAVAIRTAEDVIRMA